MAAVFPQLDVLQLGNDGTLFLSITRGGILQIGTCGHCAVLEKGRPERAEDATGNGLDFQRDRFLEVMAAHGVCLTILEQYECP